MTSDIHYYIVHWYNVHCQIKNSSKQKGRHIGKAFYCGQCRMVFQYHQSVLATNPIKYSKTLSETWYFLFISGGLARSTIAWGTRAVLSHWHLHTQSFVQHLAAYLNTCMLKLPLDWSQHSFPCHSCSEVLYIQTSWVNGLLPITGKLLQMLCTSK